MKRAVLFGITLCMVLIFAGCGGSAPSPTSGILAGEDETDSEHVNNIRDEAHENIDSPVARFTIEEWDGGSDTALEQIYEDDFFRYYLSSIRSHLIMLNFYNGQRISLGEAISQNMVDIDELIASGLQVISERKTGEAPMPASGSSYEAGRVWLVAGGTEHEPGEHFLHGAINTENGLLSASGIPFEFWLYNHLHELPEIQYTPGMQIIIDGEYGRIVTFPQEHPEYYGDYRQIGLIAESFIDGVAIVALPFDSGTYLVYVDVHWSGGGYEFTLVRYIFKIARIFELDDIPEHSPSLYVNISADGAEPQHIRGAQGTTSWFPANAFIERFQIGDVIPGGGYEASGFHPLDFWRESWHDIDFVAFKTDLDNTEGEIEVRLEFDFPPTSIQVKRWSTEYIGMSSEMWNIYEIVETTSGTFRFFNDGNDYIYEVVAGWARGENAFGSAFYTFRLNSGR